MSDETAAPDPTSSETASDTPVEAAPEPTADTSSDASVQPVAEAAAETNAETLVLPEKYAPLIDAMNSGEAVEGKVIGWNNGGYHVVLHELAAFCPKSEMEAAEGLEPEEYLDRTFPFFVLRIEDDGRRVVLSRTAAERAERTKARVKVRGKVEVGAELDGTVASLTDFGAFVDLGAGVQGLVHVSELAHRRVNHPGDMLEEGQVVQVKVLKIQGRRISLSMRALEPDPWKTIHERLTVGTTVTGKVERVEAFGAFIQVAPGLTGLLPASKMAIPRDSSPARVYNAGREVRVQVDSIDERRKRISLGLPGTGSEGTRQDYQEFQKQQDEGSFNALAAALQRARDN